jgi:hypothetical protein
VDVVGHDDERVQRYREALRQGVPGSFDASAPFIQVDFGAANLAQRVGAIPHADCDKVRAGGPVVVAAQPY